jgi:excisionase family DNA binding protein
MKADPVTGAIIPMGRPARLSPRDLWHSLSAAYERNSMGTTPKGKRARSPQKAGENAGSDEEITLQQAAGEFRISVRTLHRYRAKGQLPGVRHGRSIRVRREDVERAVAWENPTALLRKLLSTDDLSPLEAWMEGWKQLTRLTARDAAAAQAWIAWADTASRQNPGGRVGDYRIKHLLRAAEAGPRQAEVDLMIHSMRHFGGDTVARDALRSFFTSVAPWTPA